MLLFFVLLVCGVLRDTRVQGGRIVYPDELPNLKKELGVDNAISTRFSFPNDRGSCTTRDGQAGECLPLSQCPELLNYIRSRGGITSNEDIQFLRGRICRFLRNNVDLCCVKNNIPDPLVINSTRGNTKPSAMVPSMAECGFTVNNKITNGVEIAPGSHPWLVGVGFPRENQPFRVLCGGTLVTKRHVITAAHCFLRQPGLRALTHIRLGEHSLSRSDEQETAFTLKIESRKSPGYNRVSHVNDLELLTMERDVDFTNFVRPACLPFGFEGRTFENEQMTIVGWGDTFHRSGTGSDVPLAADISVIPKPACREAYRTETQVPLDETMLCAGQGPEDACQGDSGGPLLYLDLKVHSRVFLMGVVSFGVECANPAFPGVYTFIPQFLEWITQNL